MEKLKVILFYKFVKIDEPEKFVREHLKFCRNLGILGRVLVSHEGINGSVSGTKEEIEKYKTYILGDSRFEDIVFKEDWVLDNPFTKIKVKLRPEIVTFGKTINIDKKGEYVSPEKLKEMYDKKEEFIILDARNNYEYDVGRFQNAIHLDIRNFRDFPAALDKIKEYKNKKIVTYCTGGIRCEKATAYMKENGFQNVMQLQDGILNFGKKFPDTFWEGKCFVFDKRLISKINSDDKSISECFICKTPSDLYRNCRNENCDRLFISCPSCQEKFNGCCSHECLIEFRKQCTKKAILNQGRRILNS